MKWYCVNLEILTCYNPSIYVHYILYLYVPEEHINVILVLALIQPINIIYNIDI